MNDSISVIDKKHTDKFVITRDETSVLKAFAIICVFVQHKKFIGGRI